MTNLATLLVDSTERWPDRPAVVAADRRLTYAELDRRANQVAHRLASQGVAPGDRVAMSLPNSEWFTAVYFGILKVGAVVVPLNVLLKPREVAYHLTDSGATAYVAHEGTDVLPIGEAAVAGFEATPSCRALNLLPAHPDESPAWSAEPTSFETVERDDEDTAVILYTSGTTGQPKGAELRHRNMRDNAQVCGDVYRVDPEVPDAYLCVLPLFHSFGQTCLQNGSISRGGVLVVQERFDPVRALHAMAEHDITVFAGVPTMYWGLLGAWEEATAAGVRTDRINGTLRIAASGGAALPVEIHRRFRERSGVTILEGYGLSETSPAASFSPFGQEPRVGSIGLPIPGVEMKLINDDWSDVPDDPDAVGEIAIKGHNVMKGYHDRPEATAEAIKDGWFRSGDLAKKDADGFYYIVDRSKDMIIRGGFNVYPREIEEVLMEHPAVSLVAVIGVPHESHGEEIKAVVVKAKDHDDVTEADLVAWAKEQLAAYKYPRIVQFVDELPMTSTGKILKRELT